MPAYLWDGTALIPLGGGVIVAPPVLTNRARLSRVSVTLASGVITPPTNPRAALVPGTYNPSLDQGGSIGLPVGVLPGSTLAVRQGDFVVTSNGQVVENLEIFGSVNCGSFSNPIVRNCRIWGTLRQGTDTSFVFGTGSNLRGALIEDCDLFGRGSFFMQAGRGGGYTMRRCHVSGAVDGWGFTNTVGNVLLEANWAHNGLYGEWTQAQSSPQQGGDGTYPYQIAYYTHNDGVQFHVGKNYTIRGNMIGGVREPWPHHTGHASEIDADDCQFNSAILVKQEVDNSAANKIENVLIESNWLMGGAATLNVTTDAGDATGPKNYLESVVIRNNRFIRSTWDNKLAARNAQYPALGTAQRYVLRDPGLAVFSGNVMDGEFDANGAPVPVVIGQGNNNV